MKFTLHELVIIGTIVSSVTTAYILLSRDVGTLKETVTTINNDIDNVKRSTDQIKLDQIKISVMMDYLYYGEADEVDQVREKRGLLDKTIERAVNKRKNEQQ